jgi:hypothetical protein
MNFRGPAAHPDRSQKTMVCPTPPAGAYSPNSDGELSNGLSAWMSS